MSAGSEVGGGRVNVCGEHRIISRDVRKGFKTVTNVQVVRSVCKGGIMN